MAGKRDFVLKDGPDAKDLTRQNHYVPQWYQRGFTQDTGQLHYLDLSPETKELADGRVIRYNERCLQPPSKCFVERDLYTTFFGPFISDIIEKRMFGKIDEDGSKAVRAFIDGSPLDRHERFMDFFNYIDAQRSRTPKGLTWLKDRYGQLDQSGLMMELQAVQKMNCTIWLEGVREIVSAKNANLKFIISDHPVTIYNHALPPEAEVCNYPNDPPVAWKASQTIFPLDKDHCLLLTNYEYASDPELADPNVNRTNARNFAETFVRTNAFIRERELNDEEVRKINFIIKKRARRYIAAAQKEWLFPEAAPNITWESVKRTLLPPAGKIHEFSGEMYFGFKDGSTRYQDQFGRTSPNHEFLKKKLPNKEPAPGNYCPCGQGRDYQNCCRDKPVTERPAWNVLSIRERNIIFYRAIQDIMGYTDGKTWDDTRREISNEQVRQIHQLFGDLWPRHTDLIALLPKPDDRVRVVYMGVIDLRTISLYATSGTLYFDEIIIQNPFINPGGINTEFSPLEKPERFKQQTLKNLMLLFALFPLIETGNVNFIPDPGAFNSHLQHQVLDIGKQRKGTEGPRDETEMALLDELLKEDHERVFFGQPEAFLRKDFRKTFPDAPEKFINGMYELVQKKRLNAPLAILQDDLYQNGGQMTIMSMAPGFEIAMFLAQVTGAAIFTDSPTRWAELVAAQHQENALISSRWTRLIDTISGLQFPFSALLETVLIAHEERIMGSTRRSWKNIFSAVRSADMQFNEETLEIPRTEITEASITAIGEMAVLKPIVSEASDQYHFNASFDCIIPNGGIEHNNVLRLLITCGVQNYSKSVPMAIFVRPANTNVRSS